MTQTFKIVTLRVNQEYFDVKVGNIIIKQRNTPAILKACSLSLVNAYFSKFIERRSRDFEQARSIFATCIAL